jgi:hypothetical protein
MIDIHTLSSKLFRITRLHPSHPHILSSSHLLSPRLHHRMYSNFINLIIPSAAFYGGLHKLHSLTLNMRPLLPLGRFWPSNTRHRHISFLQLHSQHVKMHQAEVDANQLRMAGLSMDEAEVESTSQILQMDGGGVEEADPIDQAADDEAELVEGPDPHEDQVRLVRI